MQTGFSTRNVKFCGIHEDRKYETYNFQNLFYFDKRMSNPFITKKKGDIDITVF